MLWNSRSRRKFELRRTVFEAELAATYRSFAKVGIWPLWIAIHKGHYLKDPVMRSSGLASGLMACMLPIDPLVHFS